MQSFNLRNSMIGLLLLLNLHCVSVPPEITKLHQKELEIIESLRSSHLAMVDAYVDQKILVFENFFFNEYGPAYKDDWMETFKQKSNRDYEESIDFPKLYNDLVALYLLELEPIEKIRVDLKASISKEYSNTMDAHDTVDRWLVALKKMNDSQRKMADSLLGKIKPGMSLDAVDKALKDVIDKTQNKLDNLKK